MFSNTFIYLFQFDKMMIQRWLKSGNVIIFVVVQVILVDKIISISDFLF